MPEKPTRKKKSTFTNVGNILNTLVTHLGLDRRLREQALFNLWPIVVSDTFAAKTRPLFIDYENNLVIAVENASVAQEISFHKQQIINKLKQAGLGTGVKIKGLRFDLKRFHQAQKQQASDGLNDLINVSYTTLDSHIKPREPDDEALAQIDLSAGELEEIAQLESSIRESFKTFGDIPYEQACSISKRISKIVAKEMRIEKWQNLNA